VRHLKTCRGIHPVKSEAIMGEWEFYRIPGSGAEDAPYLWCWRCRQQDGTVINARDTFRFFLDCVAHARLHGYSNGPLLTRREPPYGFVPRLGAMELHGAAQSR
jgi:hypothetical protein